MNASGFILIPWTCIEAPNSISFIDAGKKTSDFRKLKVNLAKGELKEFSLPLDEIIIKELKMDFTKVSSVLFYVESKREDGFWGNVVLKDISIL